jgi:hypothetical protein
MKRKPITYKVTDSGCFICTSHSRDDAGYIKYYLGRGENGEKMLGYMHKFIYEECFGSVPDGLVVRHGCDNPSCINPQHLDIGTPLQNSADMVVRHRVARGTSIHTSKLTEDDVRSIRKSNLTEKELGKMFGVSSSTINKVKRGIRWKHIQ